MLGVIAFVVFVLVAVGIALVVGDSGNKKNVAATATPETSSTTTITESETTTTTLAGTQTPSATIGTICTTPEEASKAFVESWIAGDQAAAARCATNAAVTTIFQTSGAGAQYTFQGCGGDPGVPSCSYTYEGGVMVLSVAGTEATGWKVQSLEYAAD
jgi:hypothetical protein